MPITVSSINRVIAHKIKAKSRNGDAYAECSDRLLQFASDTEEQRVLTGRVNKAVNNQSKSFKLAFNRTDEESVYSLLSPPADYAEDEAFVNLSKELADMMAAAHYSISFPSGYCIVCDGALETGQQFLCVIKADYQEVFNIQGNTLVVINNVFLSPARDFYKIGMFIYNDGGITPYVYDDQFSAVKIDLTQYFYDTFLGLKTSDNDILLSKAFYTDTAKFIDNNSPYMDPMDAMGLKQALNVYFRENAHQIISASDFCENYLAGTDLAVSFTEEVVNKYPRAFTRRTELLDRRVNLQRVGLSNDATLLLKPSIRLAANIANPTEAALRPYINSGRSMRVVVLETEE